MTADSIAVVLVGLFLVMLGLLFWWTRPLLAGHAHVWDTTCRKCGASVGLYTKCTYPPHRWVTKCACGARR
jgi:hypothetical protein